MAKINSKQKGSRGEREFANYLKKLGYSARRTQQFCGNTGDASDVVCKELSNFHFEVKRVENLNLEKAFAQALHDCNGKLPLVAHRKNRYPWLITLKITDFLSLLGFSSSFINQDWIFTLDADRFFSLIGDLNV